MSLGYGKANLYPPDICGPVFYGGTLVTFLEPVAAAGHDALPARLLGSPPIRHQPGTRRMGPSAISNGGAVADSLPKPGSSVRTYVRVNLPRQLQGEAQEGEPVGALLSRLRLGPTPWQLPLDEMDRRRA